MTFASRLVSSAAFLPLLLCLLSGCGVGPLAPASVSEPEARLSISGRVHGGQQPVVGSHIYLYGVRGDQNGPARPLLGTDGAGNALSNVSFDNAAGSGSDALGTYVLTDSSGSFSFNGTSGTQGADGYTYTCNHNTLVYALAVGGDPGTGTPNSAIEMMANLGPCSTTTLSSTLYVYINEVSTVAAAYALSGYMTGPINVGYDNTALGQTGILNASANVAQLVDLGSGMANVTTPNGFGTVPAASIYTLANILSTCVNSTGPTSMPCSTLFQKATSTGTTIGSRPSETLTAILNIAHHPAANVATLYSLVTPTPAFGGGLMQQPNDFTLPIGFTYASSDLYSPGVPAVGSDGSVVLGSTLGPTRGTAKNPRYALAQLSPLGVPTSYSSMYALEQASINPVNGQALISVRNFTGYGLLNNGTFGYGEITESGISNTDDLRQLAVVTTTTLGPPIVVVQDFTASVLFAVGLQSGSAYTPVSSGNSAVAAFSRSGDPNEYMTASYQGIGVFTPVPQQAGQPSNVQQNITVCHNSGAAYCTGGGLSYPTSLALDSRNYIWALNNNSTISLFNPTTSANGNAGNYVNGSPFSGGGLNTTTVSPSEPDPWIAIDGASNAWVANYTGTISQFNSSGTALSPSTGLYGVAATCKGQGLAIDGSGNVWVGCDNSTAGGSPYTVLEYIGAATPVYTPITQGHLGVKP